MMHPNIASLAKQTSTNGVVYKTGQGTVFSCTAIWGTGTPNTLILRDSITPGAGTIIFQASRATLGAIGNETQHFTFPGGIAFGIGLIMEFPVGMANACISYA